MAAGALNPAIGEPSHLFVVEDIDLDDEDNPYVCHLRCPYPLVEVRDSEEYKEPRRVHIIGAAGERLPPRYEHTFERRSTIHVGQHYCTVRLNGTRPEPVMIWYSRWRDPTQPETAAPLVCARFELNPRVSTNAGCYYDDVANNNGLIEAIVGWRNADRLYKDRSIPPPLPTKPGEYPIYYWSDGWGEGFEDGFTFDKPGPLTPEETAVELNRRRRMEPAW